MKKVVLLVFVMLCSFGCGCSKKEPAPIVEEETPSTEVTPEPKEIEIIDVNSTTRPLAVVINNSSVAVKVQTGLQQAYMVYEFPVEGYQSRLMALYKDIDDLKIGTIRSARHNFLDYAMEHDAVFVHFGWSHYAEDDEKNLGYDYINGIYGGPFWRENPEALATEHTAYTSIGRIKEYMNSRGMRTTSDQGLVLNYEIAGVDLTTKEGNLAANNIVIPYSGRLNTTYEYDSENKVYKRFVNGSANIDYYTKEQFTTKNIIVQKVNTKMASDNYYWDIETVGSGDGYYITNGYAVPIKWSKESRSAKTKYTYVDGTEVLLNDGNTYIQLQSTSQNLTIN